MADEVAVAATEEAPSPTPDESRQVFTVYTGIETDSLRLEPGDEFDGTGLTSEQLGHLLSLGAIVLKGQPAPVTPHPELIGPDLAMKMAGLAAASVAPEPLKEAIAQEGPDGAAQRAAALNALLSQIAPEATADQVAAVDALVETSAPVTPDPATPPVPEVGAA